MTIQEMHQVSSRVFAMTACALLFLSFAGKPALAQKQLLDRVVAIVNDEAITQSELDYYLRPIFEELKKNVSREEDLMRRLNELRLKLLNQMIEDRLVYQEAKAKQIEVDEAEIDRMVEEFKNRFPPDTDLRMELAKQGFSMEELRESYRRQVAIRRLQDLEIRSQVVVSPREIEEFYQNRKPELAEEEKINIWSITIRKSQEAVEKGLTDEEARKKLETIDQRIRAGENFGQLAREFSEDAHAAQGGGVGWVKRGEMMLPIDEVLFRLPEGAISPILETSEAYHLFRVENKIVSHVPSLEEARGKIQALLFKEEAKERFEAWMNQLKSRAYISIR